MVPKVLVTGASGFLASHCIRILLGQGYKVRATMRSLEDKAKEKLLKDIYPNADHPLELVEFDLNQNQSCTAMLQGCQYVIHIASPLYSSGDVIDDAEMVEPAVNGTLMVLQAASEVDSVRRVVLTGSIANVNGIFHYREKPFTEEEWTDISGPEHRPYVKSKTLAEQAAWKFMEKLSRDKKFELVVILSGYLIGPPVIQRFCYTMTPLRTLMQDPNSFIPNRGYSMIDVCDVAMAHIMAMHAPAAAGQRILVTTHRLWYKDVAEMLREEFEKQGFKIPSEEEKQGEAWRPPPQEIPKYVTNRMTSILCIEPHSAKSMVIDAAYKLIELGLVTKPVN